MTLDPSQLPDDVAALKVLLIAAETRVADAEKKKRDLAAEIETLKLTSPPCHAVETAPFGRSAKNEAPSALLSRPPS